MTVTKRAKGRPKKPAVQQRTRNIFVRLSPAEKAECVRAAGREGEGPWSRRVLLHAAREVNKNK